MKIMYKISALLLLSVAATSCELDVTPPTSISAETFWKNDQDAWYGLNECYRDMPAVDIWDETTTDNGHSNKPWEGNFELVQNGGISTAATYGSYSFNAIRDANNFIANVDNCEMDEGTKTRMKAEARVLRAFSYMRLTAYFGKVPIIEEVLPFDASPIARNSVEEVRAYILKELEEASTILPESYDGSYLNETARVTKYGALALRARAALYFGNYVEAEKSAKQIMESKKYSLFRLTALTENHKKELDEMELYIDFAEKGIDKETFGKGMFSYEGIWQSPNASAKNPEFVLTKEFGADPATSDWYRYTYMISLSMSIHHGYSSFEPTQELINAYWDIDGKTLRPYDTKAHVDARAASYEKIWNDAKDLDVDGYIKFATSPDLKTYEFMKEFRNRDSRLYASAMFPFKSWLSAAKSNLYYRWDPAYNSANGNESWSGYAYRKIVSVTPYDRTRSSDPYPVVRYAEILLIFAEARLMTTGYDAEVRAALNDIRDRCGMPDVPASLGKDEAIDFIRNERRIELAAEGHRYNDIRRYGNDYATKYMTGPMWTISGEILNTKAWNSKLMLMPIPQSAIDKNPLLADDQNPGY